MSQKLYRHTAVLLSALMLMTGCAPQQPIFFGEDGDLSHYINHATEIAYPDVEVATLEEVETAQAPLTLHNANFDEAWDLTLEDAIHFALANSKVIRQLGGQFLGRGDPTAPNTGVTPSFLLTQPGTAVTVYTPALQETASPSIVASTLARGNGVEAALSAFDAIFSSQVFWEKNDRPQNFATGTPFPALLNQDAASFQAEISKTSAYGGTFAVRNVTTYDQTFPLGVRALPSVWTTDFEFSARQPFLQGFGAQYNRIAGPFNPFTGVGTSTIDGVVLARIDTDISLADFETAVRDFVNDVEFAYWELYFAYRNLEARKVGLESALATWKRIYSLYRSGLSGGDAADEAQAREQYFLFRSQAEQAKSDLFTAENRLRYIMGLSISDGRLIRPADEPNSAKWSMDWHEALGTALARSQELRRQKWTVKRREMEYIAAKNHLLPRLDGVALYRFHGFGDQLLDPNGVGVPPLAGSNAFSTLTNGDFQEWELGVQFSLTLGFRAELAAVRHTELMLARDKAVLREQELELSHQLADAIRFMDANHVTLQTNFNRRVAAAKQVEAIQAKYEAGTATLDLLLQAQRRRADSEAAYFRSLVDYNEAIAQLHLRMGTLLEYNGVKMAEGPWPGKAYFDALRLARQRDASMYLDYGFTRPKVFSRGPLHPHGHPHLHEEGVILEGGEYPADGEIIPVPMETYQGTQLPATDAVQPAGHEEAAAAFSSTGPPSAGAVVNPNVAPAPWQTLPRPAGSPSANMAHPGIAHEPVADHPSGRVDWTAAGQ
ncbi:MAG: TolC family protein [Planctomycetota bacterium]|nr:MAG: TolC family protein [Planctomycetota bacterium]REJ93225.1 MAG: TolC family protein [Planctomycetota bacterium]REK26038.1 MAG: TolC family protein [Planctomycetota bacterium]REK49435.1 MAG: TolC family protein [Planctomycetota bacterium]